MRALTVAMVVFFLALSPLFAATFIQRTVEADELTRPVFGVANSRRFK